MAHLNSLAEHLAPDTINQLRRAAAMRIKDARILIDEEHYLAALYLLGYSVEMILGAACFQNAGFNPNEPIDPNARHELMVKARGLKLMRGDPHPLVGWAQFLEWQWANKSDLTPRVRGLLKEAVTQAELAYKHWRPELRYKTAQPSQKQVQEIQMAANWFIDHRDDLCRRR